MKRYYLDAENKLFERIGLGPLACKQGFLCAEAEILVAKERANFSTPDVSQSRRKKGTR
jgi:hypothetical protein